MSYPPFDPAAVGARYVLVRVDVVASLTGYSSRQIRRLVASGKFPVPLHVGPGTVRWRSDEVQAWLDSRPRVNVADPARVQVVAAAQDESQRRRAARRAQRNAERGGA